MFLRNVHHDITIGIMETVLRNVRITIRVIETFLINIPITTSVTVMETRIRVEILGAVNSYYNHSDEAGDSHKNSVQVCHSPGILYYFCLRSAAEGMQGCNHLPCWELFGRIYEDKEMFCLQCEIYFQIYNTYNVLNHNLSIEKETQETVRVGLVSLHFITKLSLGSSSSSGLRLFAKIISKFLSLKPF